MSSGLRPCHRCHGAHSTPTCPDETSEEIIGGVLQMQTPAPPPAAVAKPRKIYVLYHGGGCLDGFTAAWVAYRQFGDRANYTNLNYEDPLPLMVDGSDIFILDFAASPDSAALTRESFLALQARMHSIVFLDHHKTSRPLLEGIEGSHIEIDEKHSGAMLTWNYFYPGIPAPDLIRFVEDGDLWTWENPRSRAVNAALRTYPQSFKVWDDLIARDTADLITAGEAMLRFEHQLFEKALRAVRFGVIDGHKVPFLNSNVFKSEFGARLCAVFSDAPFVAIYHDRKDKRIWSLRSRKGGFDVEQVALKFGGGGHASASGYQTDLPRE